MTQLEENYTVTRAQILEAARALLGVRFRHQGRNPQTGLDCVGVTVAIGKAIDYPYLLDVTGYRRTPSADTIRQTLRANCDEIPAEDAKPGDIFLMRQGGIKPRHAAVYWTDSPVPSLIHAARDCVKIQPLSDFPASWYVAAFRVKGVVD